MPKRQNSEPAETLQGWHEIAQFLGQPLSVAERWAQSDMPVEHKGRGVYASREELRRWLGRESAGEPVEIGNQEVDLSAELRRGLSYVRKARKKS